MRYYNIFIASLLFSFNIACSSFELHNQLKHEDINSNEFIEKIAELQEEEKSTHYLDVAAKVSKFLNHQPNVLDKIPLNPNSEDFDYECIKTFELFDLISKADLKLQDEDFIDKILIYWDQHNKEEKIENKGTRKEKRDKRREEGREKKEVKKVKRAVEYLHEHGMDVIDRETGKKIEEAPDKKNEHLNVNK